jgi:subtilase family serine protease
MQRNFVRQFAITSVVIALVSISVLSAAFIARARQNSPYVLTSQTVPLVSRARLLGAANAQQQPNLSIGLQLRNRQELQTLLSDQSNPRSPRYHQFLSPQQFVDEFDPTADQQQQVIDYLRQQGLRITHISSNRLLIDASASVAQAEAAFHVSINTYQLGSNVFYANANPPTIPGPLSSIIASISGLDNSVHMRPLYRRANLGIEKPKPALVNKSHSIRAHPRGLGGGYGPTELNSAYDATPLLQAGIQGYNQTVAVFELDGYPGSDVTQYFQAYNLGNPSITNVLVDGFNGSAGQWAIEVDLDIEVVAAMAPEAAQIVYEGPNTTQGINDTYNQIVTDNKAQITTISWGLCESQSGNAELQTLDNIFSQGAAEGISMFAASGDAGAYDCGDTNLAVDSPASDPNIAGVGGTNLQLNNGTYDSESVWSNPNDTQRGPQGLGGGGGLSSFFKQPAWQTGPNVKNQ